jgi:hypothetical protein
MEVIKSDAHKTNLYFLTKVMLLLCVTPQLLTYAEDN